MIIPMQKALDGISVFASNDVIAKMPNGINKMLALMAVSAMRLNPQNIVKPYETVLKASGFLSEDGSTVDTSLLRKAMEDSFGQMPSFQWMGFTFNADDAETLIQRMEA